MKPYKLVAAIAVLVWCGPWHAAAETFAFTNLNTVIPDGLRTGVFDTRSIAMDAAQVTGMRVTLDITGNFNGDLYVYLQHGDYLSVLLNRPGRTESNPDGYDDSGFRITLWDGATADIHNYQEQSTPAAHTPLTGLWQPDGRNVDPGTVRDTDARNAGLGGFIGQNPTGDWKLFLADMSLGGTNMLNGWQLEIAPEPGSGAIALVGVGVAVIALRRRRSH